MNTHKGEPKQQRRVTTNRPFGIDAHFVSSRTLGAVLSTMATLARQ